MAKTMRVLYQTISPDAACVRVPAQPLEVDATYSDIVGKRRQQLKSCLASLHPGDTLCLFSETHLSDDLGAAVELLGQIARRGVDVWIGRTGKTLRSADSPFLRLDRASAKAAVAFRKAFISRKAREGFQAAKAAGAIAGRPRSPLPDGFEKARSAWLDGRLTTAEAAAQCGMPYSTFRRRAGA